MCIKYAGMAELWLWIVTGYNEMHGWCTMYTVCCFIELYLCGVLHTLAVLTH